MKRKNPCALLCLLLVPLLLLSLLALTGCGKKTPATGKPAGKTSAAAENETEELFFRGTPINAGGPYIHPYITPYVDPEEQSVTAALEDEQEDGTHGTVRLARNKDGVWEILPDTYRPFRLPEGELPNRGTLTESGAVLLTVRAGTCSVALLDENYACTASVAVNKVLPDSAGKIQLSVGADGTIWVASANAYAVLEPDLSVRFADRLQVPLEIGAGCTVAADSEGGAWLLSGNSVLCMDRNGQHTATLRIEEEIDPSMGALYCFDGVLYASVSRGLIACRDGAWSLAVDYAAADITRNFTFPCALLSDGEMLFNLYNGDRMILWDYRYVPRPTGSAETIRLELVMNDFLSDIAKTVADFNRSQDRIRVVVKETADLYGYDRDLADDAFGRDLVTGVYRPDMVCDVSVRIRNAIAQHNLYVDLSWYLSNDEDVNFDNLFGAALKTVTYRDTIWGMPRSLYLCTLVGRNDILGDFAGRSGWTVGEEIAFIRSLPDDIDPMFGLRQDLIPNKLTYYRDLRDFVDMETMSCSFTSPEAIDFLAYLVSRPTTNEELDRVSRIDAADYNEALNLRRDGKVALEEIYIWDLDSYFSVYSCFFTEDVTMIGYPTNTPGEAYSGFVTDTQPWSSGLVENAVTILKDSAHPEACWEFIKYAVRHGDPSFILKDEFEKYIEECEGREFAYYDDGKRGDGYTDRRKSTPGLHITFRKEDAEELRNILENAGRPWLVGYDDSLTEIVEEELSALSAGHVTPEECAERLQSRVSLWLAERK
ncbi:MAG: hypothetical protein II889_05500 [Clostridia bacterium]|nr:hypothetical protein [Clostridia bacterium]